MDAVWHRKCTRDYFERISSIKLVDLIVLPHRKEGVCRVGAAVGWRLSEKGNGTKRCTPDGDGEDSRRGAEGNEERGKRNRSATALVTGKYITPELA